MSNSCHKSNDFEKPDNAQGAHYDNDDNVTVTNEKFSENSTSDKNGKHENDTYANTRNGYESDFAETYENESMKNNDYFEEPTER